MIGHLWIFVSIRWFYLWILRPNVLVCLVIIKRSYGVPGVSLRQNLELLILPGVRRDYLPPHSYTPHPNVFILQNLSYTFICTVKVCRGQRIRGFKWVVTEATTGWSINSAPKKHFPKKAKCENSKSWLQDWLRKMLRCWKRIIWSFIIPRNRHQSGVPEKRFHAKQASKIYRKKSLQLREKEFTGDHEITITRE